MRIVIANSIGIDKDGYYIIHSPSRWSEGVKNRHHWFAYYPWELAYLSALLKQQTKEEVCLLDGCLMRLNRQQYYECILAKKPDFLIMESATRMIEENAALALDIKKQFGTKLVFVGSHATAFPGELLEKGIDYVCIGEYEYTVLEIIQDVKRESILGLYPNKRRSLLDVNSLPWPEDDDISRLAYSCPGEPSSEYREIQMYASRGCLSSCDFCVARHVYYNQPNWRQREVKDIIKEIFYLKEKYPAMEGIFFDEEAHNTKKDFIIELTQTIIAAGLDTLHYEAMCDVRYLDEEILKAMKKAGYYKIRIGIETASQLVAKAIKKTIDLNNLRDCLFLAKEIGLKTYGTFIFGAPGSSRQEDDKTILLMRDFINNKLLDNLQLSICTPQPGTPFYEWAKDNGFLRSDMEFNRYDGGNYSMVSYPGYQYKEIEAVKRRALLTRDHCFLQKKISCRAIEGWLRSIYKRYGILGFISKSFLRLVSEVRYHWEKRWK